MLGAVWFYVRWWVRMLHYRIICLYRAPTALERSAHVFDVFSRGRR